MPRSATVIALSALLLWFGLPAAPAATEWKPLDPADLALEHPRVQPSADAEAMLWEVRVADELNTYGDVATTFEHYLRVKIFTDRARESFSTIDLPYGDDSDVRDVAARTIRPDGSIVEVTKSDIYRRTIVKTNDRKVKVVSFAIPAVERGVIVDYKWRQVFRDSLAANLHLPFSREIPVHDVRYYIRPLAVPGFTMVVWPFNGQFKPPEKQQRGFHLLRLANVPADVDEEYGPPEFERRPWIFIGYEPKGRSASPEYALKFGKELHDEYTKRTKPNDTIRALAAQAVAGDATEAEKVAALVKVARQKIRRADVDTSTPEDLRQIRETKNAADALARGVGTADDVMLLFVSLAIASGLDARAAALADRSDLFPRSIRQHPYFIRGRIAAVRSGSGWLFADPANEHSGNGELPWGYENQPALVADPKEAVYAQTPLSPPRYSVKTRTGTFRLLEDGTLEGDARLEYTGHWAELFREQEDQDAPSEREKDLRSMVTRRLPGAELSDIRIEHVTELAGPYTNSYRIRIPGYAQRTGSRMILPPAVFQKGVQPVFPSVERKHPVYFPFPWTEEDLITIEIPPGFTAAAAPPRKPMDVGAARFEPSLDVSARKLVFRRKLTVGTGGIFFEQVAYPPLRAFFDAVHRVDAEVVVLTRQEGSE